MTSDFEQFSSSLRSSVSIPDKVTEFLRGMILSGEWRPGDRIVETKVARQLGIGQSTVREALVRMEEAGLVRRYLNSGCVVTRLSEKELGQMFQVRIELECLAVELAAGSEDPAREQRLRLALDRLRKAARRSKVDDYYRADLDFHRTIWELAANPFLEKALTQVIVPLFNFALLGALASGKIDLAADAEEHGQLVDAILNADRGEVRGRVRRVLNGFWNKGLNFTQAEIAGRNGRPGAAARRTKAPGREPAPAAARRAPAARRSPAAARQAG